MPSTGASGAQWILDAPAATILWRLATPNIVAVAMMTAVTFADVWFVGHLGTERLASLALVFPFLTLMQMMSGGAIGGGTTSAVARALGAGDLDKAERIAWHAVLIAFSMSGLFTLILCAFARPVFGLVGGTGAVLDGAVTYAQIVFGGALVTWFAWVIAAIHRGTGDTVTPAHAITTGAILQIILSGALTLGWLGLPHMGLSGAALAWVLCQGGVAAYLGLYLVLGKGRLTLRPHQAQWAIFRDIMKVGGLGLLNSFCLVMTVVVITSFVSSHGAEALAGYGIGARLELMLVPISFGVGAALTAAVGVNVGANQYARARKIALTGAAVTFVLTGAIGIGVFLLPELWLGLFTADARAFEFGLLYLAIAAPAYGFFGGGQALYFASQGTGSIALPVAITIVRLFVVTAISYASASYDWGISGLFTGVAIGLVIIGVGQTLCLLGPAWKAKTS